MIGERQMNRKFAGRKIEIDNFRDFVEKWINSKDKKVLHFFGLPGIGKTSLRKELYENLFLFSDFKIEKLCIDFEDSALRETFKGMAALRNSLDKYKFPTFDIALLIYLEKTQGIKLQKSQGFEFLEEVSFLGESGAEIVKEAFKFAEIAPALEWIPKSFKFIHDVYYKYIKNRLHKHEKQFTEELYKKDTFEILKDLPKYFISDLERQLNGEKAIIFLDTYESLFEQNSRSALRYYTDTWVRDLIRYSPSNIAWVLLSREPLHWKVTEPFLFNENVIEYEVTRFDEKESENFLRRYGVDDENLIRQLSNASSGIPFYLNLALELYGTNGKIRIDFYELDQQIKNSSDLVRKYFNYLQEDELLVLKYLSIPRYWDIELFKKIAKETSYTWQKYRNLFNFSFVHANPSTKTWKLERIMRELLYNELNKDIFLNEINRIHKETFMHYENLIEDIEEREKLMKNENGKHLINFLTEAFYHSSYFMATDEILQWFNNRLSDYLIYPQLYHSLVPLLEEVQLILKNEEFNDSVIKLDLHFSLSQVWLYLSRYNQAQEELDNADQLLKKMQNLNIEEKMNLQARINQEYGEFYYFQNYYTEAEYYFEKALESLSYTGDAILSEEFIRASSYLASVYMQKKCYEKARQYLVNILEKLQSIENLHALDISDYSIAMVCQKLGILYLEIEETDESIKFLKASILILTEDKSFGKKHYSTLYNMYYLGEAYSQVNDFKNAIRIQNEILSIREELYEEDNLQIVQSLHKLGELYIREKSNVNEGLLLLKKAISICKDIELEDSNAITTLYSTMAFAYVELQDFSNAITMFNYVLKGYLEKYKNGDFEILDSQILISLANIYIKEREYDKAEEHIKMCVRIFCEKYFGKVIKEESELHEVFNCLVNNKNYEAMGQLINFIRIYIQITLQSKKIDKAEKILVLFATILKNPRNKIVSPEIHLQMLNYLSDLYIENFLAVKIDEGIARKAIRVIKESLQILKVLNRLNSIDEGVLYNKIALVYDYLEEHSNSLKYYKEAIRILENSGNKEVLSKVLAYAVIFSERIGKNSDAQIFRGKLLKIANENTFSLKIQ